MTHEEQNGLVEKIATIIKNNVEIVKYYGVSYIHEDSINDAARAVLAALQAPQDAGECATDGCGNTATGRFESGGVGSHHCPGCLAKISALSQPEAQAVPEGWKPTHRHVKTGGEYTLIGVGRMQSEMWLEQNDGDIDRPSSLEPIDMREVAIYRGADGNLWVRPREEFEDGRFASPATGGA